MITIAKKMTSLMILPLAFLSLTTFPAFAQELAAPEVNPATPTLDVDAPAKTPAPSEDIPSGSVPINETSIVTPGASSEEPQAAATEENVSVDKSAVEESPVSADAAGAENAALGALDTEENFTSSQPGRTEPADQGTIDTLLSIREFNGFEIVRPLPRQPGDIVGDHYIQRRVYEPSPLGVAGFPPRPVDTRLEIGGFRYTWTHNNSAGRVYRIEAVHFPPQGGDEVSVNLGSITLIQGRAGAYSIRYQSSIPTPPAGVVQYRVMTSTDVPVEALDSLSTPPNLHQPFPNLRVGRGVSTEADPDSSQLVSVPSGETPAKTKVTIDEVEYDVEDLLKNNLVTDEALLKELQEIARNQNITVDENTRFIRIEDPRRMGPTPAYKYYAVNQSDNGFIFTEILYPARTADLPAMDPLNTENAEKQAETTVSVDVTASGLDTGNEDYLTANRVQTETDTATRDALMNIPRVNDFITVPVLPLEGVGLNFVERTTLVNSGFGAVPLREQFPIQSYRYTWLGSGADPAVRHYRLEALHFPRPNQEPVVFNLGQFTLMPGRAGGLPLIDTNAQLPSNLFPSNGIVSYRFMMPTGVPAQRIAQLSTPRNMVHPMPSFVAVQGVSTETDPQEQTVAVESTEPAVVTSAAKDETITEPIRTEAPAADDNPVYGPLRDLPSPVGIDGRPETTLYERIWVAGNPTSFSVSFWYRTDDIEPLTLPAATLWVDLGNNQVSGTWSPAAVSQITINGGSYDVSFLRYAFSEGQLHIMDDSGETLLTLYIGPPN